MQQKTSGVQGKTSHICATSREMPLVINKSTTPPWRTTWNFSLVFNQNYGHANQGWKSLKLKGNISAAVGSLGKSMLTLPWPEGCSLTFRTGTKRERLKMRPKQPRPQQKERERKRETKTDLEMNTHLLSDEQVESKWCWGDRSYRVAKNPQN